MHFSTDSFTGCSGTGNEMVYSCCSFESPCGLAEGDCDYDDDCLGGLLCGMDNCMSSFPPSADCCYDPFPGRERIFLKRHRFPS